MRWRSARTSPVSRQCLLYLAILCLIWRVARLILQTVLVVCKPLLEGARIPFRQRVHHGWQSKRWQLEGSTGDPAVLLQWFQLEVFTLTAGDGHAVP